MAKVLFFSRKFPSYHPRRGEPTHFVEKFLKSIDADHGKEEDWAEISLYTKLPLAIDLWREFEPKFHTIRAGHRWKAGDMASPRVWGDDVNPKSGRSGPYHSKQIIIAPDIRVEKTWNVSIFGADNGINVNIEMEDGSSKFAFIPDVAKNDGLTVTDFINWFELSPTFKKTGRFDGQIVCWSKNLNY